MQIMIFDYVRINCRYFIGQFANQRGLTGIALARYLQGSPLRPTGTGRQS